MHTPDLAASLVAAVSSTLLAVLLFTLRADRESAPKPYLRVKRFLGWGLLCNTVYHSAVITEGTLTGRPFFTDFYFSPFVFYVQLYCFYNSLCAMFHLRGATSQLRTIYALPMGLLFVLLAGFCAFSPEAVTSILSYDHEDFNFWTVGITLFTHLLYFLSSLRCMVILLGGISRNREHLDDYYANRETFNQRRLVLATYAIGTVLTTAVLFSLFSLLSVLTYIMLPPHHDFLNSPQMHMGGSVVCTVLSVVLSLVVLSLQKAYYKVHQSFVAMQANGGNVPDEEVVVCAPADEPEPDVCPVAEIVEAWERRPDKPYLREGLTLAQVASELGTTTRILSAFIHKFRHVNFNTWVNQMRVDEIKRLLLSDPTLTMLDIAVKTGFNDAPAMCNVFKRFADVTPTQYRKLYTRDEA